MPTDRLRCRNAARQARESAAAPRKAWAIHPHPACVLRRRNIKKSVQPNGHRRKGGTAHDTVQEHRARGRSRARHHGRCRCCLCWQSDGSDRESVPGLRLPTLNGLPDASRGVIARKARRAITLNATGISDCAARCAATRCHGVSPPSTATRRPPPATALGERG